MGRMHTRTLSQPQQLNVAWDIGDTITTTRACVVARETPYPLIFSGENTAQHWVNPLHTILSTIKHYRARPIYCNGTHGKNK